MRNTNAPFVRSLFVLAAALSPVSGAFAVLDKFEPYAYARVLRDSNLFRISSNDEARALLGSTNKDDTIGYLGGGFRSDLKLSRQHLLLDAEVERAKYDTYSELDHTRINGRGAWAWQVGNLWSGQLGARYDRSMRSFNQSKIFEKDMRTRKTGFFSAGYQIHPDWNLEGGLSYSTVDYQDRTGLDRDATSGQLELLYRNTLNTRVGVRTRYTDNDLQEQQIAGVTVSNDYTETEISGVFYWEGSAKSNLEASFGYTTQSFDELNDRDYEGTSGRLTYNWIVTGKTELKLSVWRETSTLNDEVSNYVLTKGISLSPAWSVTPLITLSGELAYTNDDFKARNDIVTALGGERRDDDTYLYGITASWTPRRYLSLFLGYRREKRDSSIDINEFTDNQYNIGAQVNF